MSVFVVLSVHFETVFDLTDFLVEWKWSGSGVRRRHVCEPQRVAGAVIVCALLGAGAGVCVSGSTLLAP